MVSNLQISALQKVTNSWLIIRNMAANVTVQKSRKLQQLWHAVPNGEDVLEPWMSCWQSRSFLLQGRDMQKNPEKLIGSNLADYKGSWFSAHKSHDNWLVWSVLRKIGSTIRFKPTGVFSICRHSCPGIVGICTWHCIILKLKKEMWVWQLESFGSQLHPQKYWPLPPFCVAVLLHSGQMRRKSGFISATSSSLLFHGLWFVYSLQPGQTKLGERRTSSKFG